MPAVRQLLNKRKAALPAGVANTPPGSQAATVEPVPAETVAASVRILQPADSAHAVAHSRAQPDLQRPGSVYFFHGITCTGRP